MRVKRGTVRRAKHKKFIKLAKGYQGRRKSVFKLAKQAALKAGQYSYRDRRVRKRTMRAAWILKINAAARAEGLTYSILIKKLADSKIDINRKNLSDMALNHPEAFKELLKSLK